MPSQQDTDQQRTLLETHRRTLAHLLIEEAKYGGLNVPPSLLNSIVETRAKIRQAKSALRGWGLLLEDHPNDEAEAPAQAGPPTPAEKLAQLIRQASLSLQAVLTH